MRVDIYEFLSSHNNQIEDQFEQYSVLEERKDRRIYKRRETSPRCTIHPTKHLEGRGKKENRKHLRIQDSYIAFLILQKADFFFYYFLRSKTENIIAN